MEISTSILSVEKENATTIFYNLETAKTDYYHIDVMDGKFVEKDTTEIMYDYSNTIKHISNVPLDVHLMVENPKYHIDKYLPLEPNIITFHYEACTSDKEVLNLINYIKDNNIKPAISIKPNTNLKQIEQFLPLIHMVLIMTVEPGKGGQKLIPETLEKVKELKKYIEKENLNTFIEVDGGINKDTINSVKEAGADIVVAGSAIISSENFAKTIQELR